MFSNFLNNSSSTFFSLQYYMEHKVAPTIHHTVEPFNPHLVPKLCDVPPSQLPIRWRELLIEAEGRHHRSARKSVYALRPMICLDSSLAGTPHSNRKKKRKPRASKSSDERTETPVESETDPLLNDSMEQNGVQTEGDPNRDDIQITYYPLPIYLAANLNATTSSSSSGPAEEILVAQAEQPAVRYQNVEDELMDASEVDDQTSSNDQTGEDVVALEEEKASESESESADEDEDSMSVEQGTFSDGEESEQSGSVDVTGSSSESEPATPQESLRRESSETAARPASSSTPNQPAKRYVLIGRVDANTSETSCHVWGPEINGGQNILPVRTTAGHETAGNEAGSGAASSQVRKFAIYCVPKRYFR